TDDGGAQLDLRTRSDADGAADVDAIEIDREVDPSPDARRELPAVHADEIHLAVENHAGGPPVVRDAADVDPRKRQRQPIEGRLVLDEAREALVGDVEPLSRRDEAERLRLE